MNLAESSSHKSGNPLDHSSLSRRLESLSRVRLSSNFILRDFLFCASASARGFSNCPENERLVIGAGKQLCEKVLEPILRRFGRFAITFGYQSRESTDHDLKRQGHKSGLPQSSPHQWDRLCDGRVRARVDILPYCVEDGFVTKEEFGNWLMLNLDIDLLMDWTKSNVFCITIGPEPRRRWICWGRPSQGERQQTVRMSLPQWETQRMNLFLSHTDSLCLGKALGIVNEPNHAK